MGLDPGEIDQIRRRLTGADQVRRSIDNARQALDYADRTTDASTAAAALAAATQALDYAEPRAKVYAPALVRTIADLRNRARR